jgi:SAM-dependent methyltransferase
LDRSYYEEYYFFEQDNWWFVSRRRILLVLLRKLLPRTGNLEILDAGCGTGINLAYLEEFGRVTGVDNSEDAIRFCRKRGNAALLTADLRALPFDADHFDLVTALDVIEHIDEDASVVQNLVRVTKPGGHLLITVPPIPGLWSEHDEINHHKRRYRKQQLRALVEDAGCKIEKLTSMNSFLFPVAWTARTWQQLRRRIRSLPAHPPQTDFADYHPVVNALLTAIFTAETPLVTSVGMPIGLSLVCFARKA